MSTLRTKSDALTYVAFGDSITVGSKASLPENRWVNVFATQLQREVGRPIVLHNKGVGDNTISPRTTNYAETSKPSAHERVQSDVVALAPELVTVAFGLNDLRFGTPVEIFATDLEALLVDLQTQLPNATLVVLNVFHMSKYDSFPPRNRGSRATAEGYNKAIAMLAERRGVILADVAAAMGFRDGLIHADGVHAADLGHRLIGNRVFESLALSALC
jgi:lysophospholipase L1-like esterase